MPVFTYEVDGIPQSTSEHTLTPRQILEMAGLNPLERYLIEIQGKHQDSFKDEPDKPVHIHQHQKFISAFLGPVTVS